MITSKQGLKVDDFKCPKCQILFDEDTIKGLKNENIILKYNFYLNEKFIDEMKKKWDEEDEAEKTPGEVKEVVEGN